MDVVWNMSKAERNARKRGVRFEEAVTVFDDPLFALLDAGRKGESRFAVIGFSLGGRLLHVVHAEAETDRLRIISARPATRSEERIHDQ